MFLTSCILLCFTVSVSHQGAYTYVKSWDPFRRSGTQCEMCYKADCVTTAGPRCEYYAEASKFIYLEDDDIGDKIDDERHQDDHKIDAKLFEFVASASSISQYKGCIPFVSQYTDCTEENICIGCKFCTCNDGGKWVCIEKQICRVQPKMTIDHRVIGLVIETLKRKEKNHKKRAKRSTDTSTTITDDGKNKLSYTDLSKWMYGLPPNNNGQTTMGIEEILDYIKDNEPVVYSDKKNSDEPSLFENVMNGSHPTTSTSITKNDNYVDLLEFNDILQSWTREETNTEKYKNDIKEFQVNDVDYTEYDPIRLMKRDISKMEKNKSHTILQINTTSDNYTFNFILTEAVQGLFKITTEKQKELQELMNVQNNLLNIAKIHNISIDIRNNSNSTHDNYNKHHIAIYKLDTIDKCVAKVKHDINSAVGDVIKKEMISNSSAFQYDLRIMFSTIRKYLFREGKKILDSKEVLSSSEEQFDNLRNHVKAAQNLQIVNPSTCMGSILSEINKAPANPLLTLSRNAKKILKRVIKQLYSDDFAVIDFIVHEAYYDFDSYLENTGTKWTKMMQDIIASEIFDTLYRIKLLHVTLKTDISKMEDMITLLDFARNRRMTIANGVAIDKSILRIQDNLKIIDDNVQKIIQLEKNKNLRQAAPENKPAKKKSIIQKLKKIFHSSKNDIKDMLRKRFPKSEIMKRIAKKKIDDLERQKMLQYQETMKQWQDDLNVVSGREKRSSWGFKAFVDRIKNIIPGYLRGKVKPKIQKKIGDNKTHM